ncbi:neuroligin-2-like protein [Lates japonicus]|uniref:Neuroligin-2-like protein n=1 Tax=Lates japonicus TaxID=270547 RepID=A0AAD3NLN5_LATJO|nr:neuroligin-2-like protein [Lates japonicus]
MRRKTLLALFTIHQWVASLPLPSHQLSSSRLAYLYLPPPLSDPRRGQTGHAAHGDEIPYVLEFHGGSHTDLFL